MRRLQFLLSAAVVCAAIFASQLGAQDSEDIQTVDSLIDSLLAFDTVNVVAYVEYDSVNVVIKDHSHATYSAKTRIRVLREGGLDYGRVVLYEDLFGKLDDFHGRVISADGRVILSRKLKDMDKICGFGASYVLYSDICFFTSTLSAGNYPFTIEYEYTKNLASLYSWPDWTPRQEIPVLTSSYILELPDDFAFDADPINIESFPITGRSQDGRRKRISWNHHLSAPVELEDCAPPAHEYFPRVVFNSRLTKIGRYSFDGVSWASLARGYCDMVSGQFALDKAAAEEADRLVWFDSLQRPVVKGLHEELMARQRYVAISVGVGGWQPHSAMSTYNNRYGDCKDLSTLYAAMLKQNTIRAYVALARTKDLGQINPDFPTLNNFNHVILMYLAGTDTVWVDPTCSNCDLGDVPEGVEGIYVLVSDPEHGGLVRVPVAPPEDNLIERRISLHLNPDMSANIKIDIACTGNAAQHLKSASSDRTFEEFGEYLRRNGVIPDKFKIAECRFDKTDARLSRFDCSITATIPRMLTKVGAKIYLGPGDLAWQSDCENLDFSSRTQPVDLPSNFVVRDSVFVSYPPEWKLGALPKSTSLDSEFGTLSTAVLSDSSAITLVRQQVFRAVRIPAENFAAFESYQDKCGEASSAKIVFEIAN